MTPEPAQPAEAWLNDTASLESGEPAQPAESPEARAVDWSEPLEAVIDDGKVVPAEPHAVHADYADVKFDGSIWYVRLDGKVPGVKGWQVRNIAASTARPTERGAVETLAKDFERLAAALEGVQERCRVASADFESDNSVPSVKQMIAIGGVRQMATHNLAGIDLARKNATAVLALPATDQAAEVEAVIVQAVEDAANDDCRPSEAVQRILRALATQPATGRTMGGEDGLRKTLEDIETMLTPAGNVWLGTEPKWQTDAYALARAALQEPHP